MSGFNPEIEVVVGRNIELAREALEWRQADLAKATGLARSTISKIESGGTITVSTLSAIADAFGIPPYLLMLRSADWKRLANIATCLPHIERYRTSGQPIISPAEVERIQEMSASPVKSEWREAIRETNAVVAQIFGIGNRSAGPVIQDVGKSKTVATRLATKTLSTYPVINGLISHIVVAEA
jgi:transcriptional regulator with XRE-family HTH domain